MSDEIRKAFDAHFPKENYVGTVRSDMFVGYAASYSNTRTITQEELLKASHAICPHLKPWMDDEDVEHHPCHGCVPIISDDGERLHSMCLVEAKVMTKACLAAIGITVKE